MSGSSTLAPAEAQPAEAASTPPRRPRLVRAELRKIFTTSTWWLIGTFLLINTALMLLVHIVNANQRLEMAEQMRLHPPDFDNAPPGQRPSAREQQQMLEEFARQTDIPAIVAEQAANVFTSGQFLGLMFIVILGVLVVTNEFTHQTATMTFLATPRRTRVIVAKLVAAVVLATGYWLVSTAVSVGFGVLNFSLRGYSVPFADMQVWRPVAMNLLAYLLWAMLGVGFGVLIRHQLGATLTAAGLYLVNLPAALIVIGFIYANLIHSDAVWNLVVAFPGVASLVMVAAEPPSFVAGQEGLAWWIGALVLTAYGVVAGAIGTLITRRRDIS
jgi:ABC-type transport system involved in multi-copper enzyme maturation permease subunit